MMFNVNLLNEQSKEEKLFKINDNNCYDMIRKKDSEENDDILKSFQKQVYEFSKELEESSR